MVISIDAEKAIDKKALDYDKDSQQSGNRGSIIQHNKSHIQQTFSQHYSLGKN